MDLTNRVLARTPIVKIVGNFCNLACGYCFYREINQSAVTVMSQSLLAKFLEHYASIFVDGKTSIIWHGGEPLLAGKHFFHRIVELETSFFGTKEVENKIQTNATLLDHEWAKFFAENRFRVGVSLDGDAIAHDKFRRTKAGQASFRDTLRGIRILMDHGISPGIIATVSRSSADRIEEIMEFFLSLGLKGWSFNLLDLSTTSAMSPGLKEESLSNQDVINLITRVWKFWLERDDPDLSIRELDNFLAGCRGLVASSCAFSGFCGRFFCLDWDGKIYPCDRFSLNPNHLLGDLIEEDLFDILSGEKIRQHLAEMSRIPERCGGCFWAEACHNGCGAMRDPSNGLYRYCEARKEVFELISGDLE